MSRKFVCNVTPTGRFRLRPGRWWLLEPTFVVEIEEQLDYQPVPSIAWNYEESDFVWRKAREIDMMRVPAEIFEPRYISRADQAKQIAGTFSDFDPEAFARHLAQLYSPWANQSTVGVAQEDIATGMVVALDPATGQFRRAGNR